MRIEPVHALQAAQRGAPLMHTRMAPPPGTLLIAGATGALGSAIVQRIASAHRFADTTVLAQEAMQTGMRGMRTWLCPPPGAAGAAAAVDASDGCGHWPPVAATTGLVLFDPPRMYYERERALWTPTPAQLPTLARWMRRCGVRTLAVVMPHLQGRLPGALKAGLASLDEQAVAALGFERLLIVRSAEKPGGLPTGTWPQRIAHGVLSALQYMVPGSEQPIRASKLAEFVDCALRHMPPGTHVAGPELLWRASQGDLPQVVRAWLQPMESAAK